MKDNTIFLFFFIFFILPVHSSNIHVSGFVKDKQSNEVLIGGNIWQSEQKNGTTTDKSGYYNLKVNTPCSLTISYIGYQTIILNITATTDTMLIVHMSTENNLNEVIVSGVRDSKFEVTRLTAKELELIPTLGGKPDVMKVLQLLPGVQTMSEGLNLMLVRGGDPGQNQYLLDNVPLIYVNHLGGFMSVFNPDMINTVDFYKGNFPARQGGKISSIVDITQREGDISKHHGSFSIGVTDASFSIEGPLVNKKMSYIVTARKTMIDGLMALFSGVIDVNPAIIYYGFYDVNAKLCWKPDDKNNLSLNIYQGDDYLTYWGKPWKLGKNESNLISQQWGNWLVSGHWNRVFSSKLYSENILSFSRYRNSSFQEYGFDMNGTKATISTKNQSSVEDFSFRSTWKYSFLKTWNFEFGGQASFFNYEPSYIYSSVTPTSVLRQILHSSETALYLDNKINILSNLQFQPSFRLSNYSNNGINFPNIEPRLNLSLKTSDSQSFNLNFMKTTQNSHLIFAQGEILKKDIWIPATQSITPQTSNQISFSWNGSFCKSILSTEASVYYKKMQNLAALKEGYENMVGITGIENKLATDGVGISYGAEFMLRKNTGKWIGSVSYAYSHATRQFPSINAGKEFEFDFNRLHSVSLNINRQLRNSWNMNLVWLFQTGLPYTPALGKQNIIDFESGTVTNIGIIGGVRNSGRMQDYHRLDIAFSHTIKTRKGNRAVWTYSIYNIYNQINPYGYYYDNDNNLENTTDYNKPLQLYKLGLFTIIPSISYKVYFDFHKTEKKKKTDKTQEKKKSNWLYFED